MVNDILTANDGNDQLFGGTGNDGSGGEVEVCCY